ncbi:cathelicidin-related antimicrobial peptide Na_CRAMP-like [Eleutherodactylus coqui]|uniref:cathelicidin-related antimicrobial peptide Na_CRAMP-like n=1 Tax=Eleutherodactylus coqui TaxID=57060 RepID=UPI0034620594
MMSWKLSLLFFSAVTLHGCLSDAAEPEDQDERCIRHITNLYNQREGGTNLYRSLDELPSVPLQEDGNNNGYILKETECQKSENRDLSQCDFKPDGDITLCDCDLKDEDPENMMCARVPKEKRAKRSIKGKSWFKKHRKLITGLVIAYNLLG